MKCQLKVTKQNFYKYWYEPCTRRAKYEVITTTRKGIEQKTFCCGIHKNSILKRFPNAVVNVL